MTKPEVIRVDPDGTKVYVDWDDPKSLASALVDSPLIDPPVPAAHTRAQQEANQWSAEKRAKIEARLQELGTSLELQRELLDRPISSLVAGVERWYSAAETAQFFGRTNQWMYERLRKHKFRYKNGDEIEPIYLDNGWARFTTAIIREIALSCYRSGTVKRPELEVILARLEQADVGEVLFDLEEG
jgi:hypothetical protein